MKIMADFHNCVTRCPEFFKSIHKEHEFIIITASTDSDAFDRIFRFLKKHDFSADQVWTMSVDKNADADTVYRKWLAGNEWKIGMILDEKPDIYFDDKENICREVYARSNGTIPASFLMVSEGEVAE